MSAKHKLFAFSLCCSIAYAHASDNSGLSWNKLVIAGQKAVREGRLNDAARFYSLSLTVVSPKPGEPRYTESLRALADVYLAKREFDKAELTYQRELSVLEAYGKDYPDMLHDLFRLGFINDQKGQFQRSEAFYKRALSIAEKGVISKRDPKPLDILVNLCAVYYALGDLNQAESTAEKAVKSLPKSDPERAAAILTKCALELQNRGRSQVKQTDRQREPFNRAAKLLCNHALSLRRLSFGANSLPVARNLEALGDLSLAEGKAIEAERYYKEALAVRKRLREDMSFAECQLKLASLYLTLCRYEECESLTQQLASRHQYPALYPRITSILAKLSEVYVAQRKYRQTEPLFKQILSIDESKYGKYSSTLLGTLYAAQTNYCNQSKWQECKASCNRAWEIYQKARIPGDRRLGHTLAMLADIYQLENNYAESEIVRRRIVGVFEKRPGKRQVDLADALHSLAYVCSQRGKYKEAEALYSQALSIYEKIPGYDRLELSKVMFRMATNYRLQKKFVNAEPLYNRILAICKNAFGPEHSNMVTVFNTIADNYCDQGKYAKADTLYRQALSVCEKTPAAENTKVEVLRSLVGNYMRKGDVDEANKLSESAGNILAKNAKPQTSQFTGLSKTVSALADIYVTKAKYNEAEKLYARALTISQKNPNQDELEQCKIKFNLAMSYRLQNKFKEAEQLYKQILPIYEQLAGAKSSEFAGTMNALADTLWVQDRYSEATALYEQALSIFEKLYKSEHPVLAAAREALAEKYSLEGNYKQAEALYLDMMSVYEQTPGFDVIELCKVRIKLASTYQSQKRFNDSDRLYEQVLTSYKQIVGPESKEVATILNALADNYWLQAKYEEAEVLYRQALAIFEKALGLEHPIVASSTDALAQKYYERGESGKAEQLLLRVPSIPLCKAKFKQARDCQSQKKFSEAEQLYREVLPIFEKTFGPEHQHVAGTLNALADHLRIQGKNKEAEPLFARALAIFQKSYGIYHPNVAETLRLMALNCQQEGKQRAYRKLWEHANKIESQLNHLNLHGM